MTVTPQTPITLNDLVALGGTIEDKVNVRFGKEIIYRSRDTWYIGTANFKYVEDFVAWLKTRSASIGFVRAEK